MLSIKTALISKSQTIEKLKEELTLDGLRAALLIIFVDFLKSFNVKDNMTSPQIAEATDLLIMKFPNYRLEDFKLCLMYSKMNRYGKVYNHIDVSVIFDMFNQYDQERKNIMETSNIKQHTEVKLLDKAEARVGYKPEQMAQLKKTVDEILNKEKAEKKVRVFTPSEAQTRDNKWLRQFDNLMKKYSVKTYQGMRVDGKFISRYGKIMGVNEFLHHKSKQLQIVITYLLTKNRNRNK